jgi:hypothetical protein
LRRRRDSSAPDNLDPACGNTGTAASLGEGERPRPDPALVAGDLAPTTAAESRSGCGAEGLNNKIRVIRRRAYGLRDEEYLRLKVLTCMLPKM